MSKGVFHVQGLAEALGDAHRVYFDGKNYRVRRYLGTWNVAGVPTPHYASKGPVAPWNRVVKAEFSDVSEFYAWLRVSDPKPIHPGEEEK